jgi:hypothetical protein
MRFTRFVALGAAIVLLMGCNRLTSEGLPEGVLYQDTFDADTGNWILESDLDASARFADGQLQSEITASNLIAWAELGDRQFGDFVLEVDATQLSGPDDNSYGVVFRVKNSNAYYSFDISGDGYYAVKRRDEAEGGRWTWIAAKDWLESSAIHQGASTNKIKIVVQGSHFAFYVNDQQIAEADDNTYRSGAIGLNAGSFHEPGVRIGFDNLIISKPE